jgi:GNAT superfamily N-acetyltransferase
MSALPEEIELSLGNCADEDSASAILDALKSYNLARFGGSNRQELIIPIRDATGKTTGGLTAYTGRGWLYVELLFVPEELRGRGMAGRLMQLAEQEARARGCTGAYVDTMNPDALSLYLRLGYRKIGELKHLAGGHTISWLEKRF